MLHCYLAFSLSFKSLGQYVFIGVGMNTFIRRSKLTKSDSKHFNIVTLQNIKQHNCW